MFSRESNRPDAEGELLDVSSRGDGGQRVVKTLIGNAPVIVKHYGLKRGRLRTLIRNFGSICIVGKSSITAAARCRTEREVLALWKREGFRVPEIVAPPAGVDCRGPCLVMEWIPGTDLHDLMKGNRLSAGGKRELAARFAAECGRRHARALELAEPRLVMTHPSLNHVIVSGDDLVYIDLEIVYRRAGELELLIRREIERFLRSIAQKTGEDFIPILRDFVAAYPDRDRLVRLRDDMERSGVIPQRSWMRRVPGLRLIGKQELSNRGRGRNEVSAGLGMVLSGNSVHVRRGGHIT
jgi:tRNA A-37 threonylcarbamoyl transferase component Bud32